MWKLSQNELQKRLSLSSPILIVECFLNLHAISDCWYWSRMCSVCTNNCATQRQPDVVGKHCFRWPTALLLWHSRSKFTRTPGTRSEERVFNIDQLLTTDRTWKLWGRSTITQHVYLNIKWGDYASRTQPRDNGQWYKLRSYLMEQWWSSAKCMDWCSSTYVDWQLER